MQYRYLEARGALNEAAQTHAPPPPLPPALLNVPPAVIALFPATLAETNLVLPLALDGETLTVASANPQNISLSDKLSFIVNKKVRLVPFPAHQIRVAIKHHYAGREESVDSLLQEFTDTSIRLEDNEEYCLAEPSGPQAQPRTRWPAKAALGGFAAAAPRIPVRFGEDDTRPLGGSSMFFHVVEEGQRVLLRRPNGTMAVIIGPQRVWTGRNVFLAMRHYVAHPGEFLIVRFRDGRQEHLTGPTDVWFDPRVHEQITRQDALQLAAKEAVIVYTRMDGAVSRRIVYGPMLFVPAPGEWLHTFQWHGSEGGSQGVKKVSKGLVFQKLWLMPDQMYHDVTDVRTADDAVLTIKLMVFFELTDIDRMLDATHDPIGDFINAATSDVVDFTGHRTFEQFKHETGRLNELETYRQLTARAAQNGYRINKVVYRGYGAPDRLQAMHDQAIEARTKLQLERATEEQAQNLEDYKLNAQMNRAARRRTEQAVEVETEIGLAGKRQEAERQQKEAERVAAREQRRRDAESEQEIRRQSEERTRQHLAALKEMGVDLTAYLTQGRADRVIELRVGKGNTHVHLDGPTERNGS